MINTILVKIIMPSETIFQTDATMVNIPGGGGVFGVLPGHAKLISTVQIGVVSVFAHGEEKKFFVSGGMAQVAGSEVNIVTEFAASLEDQNKSDILNKIAELKIELEAGDKTNLEATILEASVSRYNSLLGFVGN